MKINIFTVHIFTHVLKVLLVLFKAVKHPAARLRVSLRDVRSLVLMGSVFEYLRQPTD